MRDLYRRAVLAFPDEDVLVGTRLAHASGFRAFRGLEDVVPRPDHRATGEERAWGRRLAKRFGAEGQLDDRTFVIKGDGDAAGLLDYAPQDLLGENEALAESVRRGGQPGVATASWLSAGPWPRSWRRARCPSEARADLPHRVDCGHARVRAAGSTPSTSLATVPDAGRRGRRRDTSGSRRSPPRHRRVRERPARRTVLCVDEAFVDDGETVLAARRG